MTATIPSPVQKSAGRRDDLSYDATPEASPDAYEDFTDQTTPDAGDAAPIVRALQQHRRDQLAQRVADTKLRRDVLADAVARHLAGNRLAESLAVLGDWENADAAHQLALDELVASRTPDAVLLGWV